MGIFRAITDRFGETIEIVETETTREAVEGARRDVRHFRFFNGEVYASVYRNLDDCNARRPFLRVHSSGKIFRVWQRSNARRMYRYGRLCARYVVATQPHNVTLDGQIDQALDRGQRFLDGVTDDMHDFFYAGVCSILYREDAKRRRAFWRGNVGGACERCGADFERPTVGTVCRACRIQEWVTAGEPVPSGETLERHDFEAEADAILQHTSTPDIPSGTPVNVIDRRAHPNGRDRVRVVTEDGTARWVRAAGVKRR